MDSFKERIEKLRFPKELIGIDFDEVVSIAVIVFEFWATRNGFANIDKKTVLEYAIYSASKFTGYPLTIHDFNFGKNKKQVRTLGKVVRMMEPFGFKIVSTSFESLLRKFCFQIGCSDLGDTATDIYYEALQNGFKPQGKSTSMDAIACIYLAGQVMDAPVIVHDLMKVSGMTPVGMRDRRKEILYYIN